MGREVIEQPRESDERCAERPCRPREPSSGAAAHPTVYLISFSCLLRYDPTLKGYRLQSVTGAVSEAHPPSLKAASQRGAPLSLATCVFPTGCEAVFCSARGRPWSKGRKL